MPNEIEDSAAEPNTPEGTEPPENTQQEAPDSQDTQLPDSEGAETVDHFDEKFDHRSLPEELQPGWKQLQASYTRKMQEVGEQLQGAELATSWLDGLNSEETRDAAFKELGEILGYEVKPKAGGADNESEPDVEDDDLAQFRDPRVDDLLAEREEERLSQALTELEGKIDTGIQDLAKAAKLKLDPDVIDLIFDEVAKYGPDEKGEPQIEKAFKRITAIGSKAVSTEPEPEAPPAPPLPGGSSPTPTVQPGSRKERLARASAVVDRAYASQ